MIRRYVKTPDVWVEKMEIGHETNTDVALMYINGICDKKLIKEVRKRLKHIDIDSILESGYIEQLIEDAPFSVFPTVYHTERPDVVAGICWKDDLRLSWTERRSFSSRRPYLFNFFNPLRIIIHDLISPLASGCCGF